MLQHLEGQGIGIIKHMKGWELMGKVINIEDHRYNIIHPDEVHTRWEFSIDPDRKEKPYITIKCGVMYGFNGWTVYIFCSSYDEMLQCRTQAMEVKAANSTHGIIQERTVRNYERKCY